MKKLLAALAFSAASILAVPAGAVTFTVGDANTGPTTTTTLTRFAPGARVFTFEDGTSPFTGGTVVSGASPGQYAVPQGDTSRNFLAVGPGPSISSPATLALSGVSQIAFYWGSIDSFNTITFNGLGQSFNGLAFDGADGDTFRNGREVVFNLTGAEAAALTGITLSSSTNAFELDDVIVGNAVPEPATYGIMSLGLGLIGAALRRRRSITGLTGLNFA